MWSPGNCTFVLFAHLVDLAKVLVQVDLQIIIILIYKAVPMRTHCQSYCNTDYIMYTFQYAQHIICILIK